MKRLAPRPARRHCSLRLCALLALSFAIAGTSAAYAADVASVDHLLCYNAKAVRTAPPRPAFVPQALTLTDMLGGPFGFQVKKRIMLCNPADKNGEDPSAPGQAIHAVGYQAKRQKDVPKFGYKGSVIEARNEFHPGGLKLTRTGEDRLLIASSQAVGTAAAPPAPTGAQDFKCYKVALAKARRGEPSFPAFVAPSGVALTDQFLTRLFDVKKPVRVCHPVVTANSDASHLVCYQLKLAKAPKQAKIPPQAASTRDALGEAVLGTKAPAELCVPSTVLPGADELIRSIEGVEAQVRMANENFPVLLRPAIEAYYPEIVALIAQGPAALDRILAEFAPSADLTNDIPLVLLAYALEKIGDVRAVPVLADWLARHVFAELVWAPEFATHALKVLTGQAGLNTTTFVYGIEEKLDTIAQATVGVSAATAAPTHTRAAPPPAGDCTKSITVRGVNAFGQPDEFTIKNYVVVTRDLDQRIAEEADATKRALLIRLRDDEYLKPDQTTYDGTAYVALPGATVSAKSNCGGSVTERVLNAVAMQKGLPFVLGPGRAPADDIREVARRFGTEVGFGEIDRTTVISHDRNDGSSAHVEVPLATTPGVGATIFSKDNFGIPRTHQVSFADPINEVFAAPIARYGTARSWNPFSSAGAHFYKIDPARITEIVVDSSACPCRPDAPGQIPVAITQPAESTTAERVVMVQGTVGDSGVSAGTLRVNGSPQALAVAGGGFASTVVLKSGMNTLGLTVDAPDGRRGCAERSIESTAPRTTVSATLTWNLGRADVDLYVTQPDGETSWYGNRTTSIGGRLDVDNINGFGPENYFLSVDETAPVGDYTVRVHYYNDELDDEETPTRTAGWRVVIVTNEGTPAETRFIRSGTLSFASSANDTPGSSGGDWATAAVVTIAPN
jgi:uncharacterized protein YfaP (DUF2135 family)